MLFQKLNKKTRIILAIQCLSMLGGASTHVLWIFENGIFTHNTNHPFFSTIFWDCLTFVDIIAALFLLIRPKLGVVLTLLIITIDVIHNNVLLLLYKQHIGDIGILIWATKYWMLIAQLFFMSFVFLTIKKNLTEINYQTHHAHNNENKKAKH